MQMEGAGLALGVANVAGLFALGLVLFRALLVLFAACPIWIIGRVYWPCARSYRWI